jgi:putative DNA primase/helicase
MQKISETARGRWHGILPQLGISPKMLRNKHGPCPMCGGSDRFRFDNKEGKGTWICNRCGSGDGAELVKRVKGIGFKEAAKMIEGVTGVAKFDPPERRQTSKKDLIRLWNEAVSIRPETHAGYYLKARCGLWGDYPDSLRQINYGNFTTIFAKVTDKDGAGVSLHKTMIRGCEVESRLLMPGRLPDNVAIRLAPSTLEVIGIAEGIETALSASVLFNVPVWAAISAPLLKKWRPPEGIAKVIIFGDNDHNFTGQAAAYALAWTLSGYHDVDVKLPSIPGWDWNDVHRNNLDNR